MAQLHDIDIDSGTGFEQDNLHKVFDRFSQAEVSIPPINARPGLRCMGLLQVPDIFVSA